MSSLIIGCCKPRLFSVMKKSGTCLHTFAVSQFAVEQFVLLFEYSDLLFKRSDAFFETGDLSIFS